MLDQSLDSSIFATAIAEHMAVVQALSQDGGLLEQIARQMTAALLDGKKVVWCGNGGSAADSQHLAAELVGRFRRERRALASIALSTNTSIVTAIGNDYGYEHVFRRQVEALCAKGDVVVGISTSGNSPNVCLALEAAQEKGCVTVAFTGRDGGRAAKIADVALRVPSTETPRIQEAHILCGHIICDWIELSICRQEPTRVALA
jgi:D-sedoheptulose 7-phosphate isomerase